MQGTKDLQTVTIWLRVLSHPMEDKLPEIYQTLGTDFDNRVLPSVGLVLPSTACTHGLRTPPV